MAGLSFFLTAALLALAGSTVNVDGVVQAITCDALGRTDGIVLKDRTYLGFRPSSMEFGGTFEPGQKIRASGNQVLTAPNRVLTRVSISRDGRKLVDDVPLAKSGEGSAAYPIATGQADSKFVFRETLGVLAVGVDRVVLNGGQTVLVPARASLDYSKVRCGAVVSVVGAATAASQGQFAVAMSVRDEAGTELLKPAKASSGTTWLLAQGVIKQLRKNARGDLEGFVLADGRVVSFNKPMPFYGQAGRFTTGQTVEVGGPASGQNVSSELVVFPAENSVIDATAALVGRHGGRVHF